MIICALLADHDSRAAQPGDPPADRGTTTTHPAIHSWVCTPLGPLPRGCAQSSVRAPPRLLRAVPPATSERRCTPRPWQSRTLRTHPLIRAAQQRRAYCSLAPGSAEMITQSRYSTSGKFRSYGFDQRGLYGQWRTGATLRQPPEPVPQPDKATISTTGRGPRWMRDRSSARRSELDAPLKVNSSTAEERAQLSSFVTPRDGFSIPTATLEWRCSSPPPTPRRWRPPSSKPINELPTGAARTPRATGPEHP